jgi:hypothetical protein
VVRRRIDCWKQERCFEGDEMVGGRVDGRKEKRSLGEFEIVGRKIS